MKQCIVILNKDAGDNSQELTGNNKRLQPLLAAHGLHGEIHWESPQHLRQRLVDARDQGFPLIIAGGGDGTLNTAVNILAGTDSILGILPLGTFNHFAKDAGIPLKLENAVRTIAQGSIQRVDLGQVNERFFLNNVSIGIYPHAVTQREAYREELGVSKLVAMGYALLRVFRRPPLLQLQMSSEGQHETIHAPFIFIGNNRYEKEPFSLVRRESLNAGHVSVFYTHRMTRSALLKLAFQILFRRLQDTPELEYRWLKAVRITCRRPVTKIALDGEVVHERSPLTFRIRPGFLYVMTTVQEE